MSEIIIYRWLVLAITLAACKNSCPDNEIRNIEVSLIQENTLRLQVEFNTNNASKAVVRYWRADSPETIYYSDTSQSNIHHVIPITLLSPQCRFQFNVITLNENCTIESPVGEFTTESAPPNLTPLTWQKFDSTAIDSYLLLYRRTPRGNVHLVNSLGEIVWYQQIQGMVKVAYWTPSQTILVLYGNKTHPNGAGSHIIEYSLSGKVLWQFDLSTKGHLAHHEILTDHKENIVALTYDTRNFDLSDLGGEPNQPITGDGITIFDRNGNDLWRWSVFDEHDPLADPDILQHLEDWGHANALSYDQDGNFLISFRVWSQIWKVDSKTGKTIWKLGQGGDFQMDSIDHFSGQHAIHKNIFQEYMLFDNGLDRRLSRIISYELDENLYKVSSKIMVELPTDFYSDRMGSAYLMNNGNLLVCSSRSKTILVLSQSGDILCQGYVGLPDPYRVQYTGLPAGWH